jgi:hypothetical protein
MGSADDNDSARPVPRVNVTRSIQDAIEEMQRMLRQIDHQEKNLKRFREKLEALRWELCMIERVLLARGEGAGTPPHRPSASAPRPPIPKPVVQNCTLAGVAGGASEATLDNGAIVTLPTALAELLAILASEEGQSPDELVPWKSLDRMGELLGQRLGRKFDRHAVSQLLWRLRGHFKSAGISEWLIESARELGARLRLKRRAHSALGAG